MAKKRKLMKRRKKQQKLTAHDIKNRLGMGGSSEGKKDDLKSGIPKASGKLGQ
jgi:hypothetical protein